MRKSSVFISVRDNSARARLYPLRVEVKIQRQLSRAGALIHSFLFRMPLARAVSLRKIVTGERQSPCGVVIYATHPLTHGFTVAASLHRATIAGPRERGHWARALHCAGPLRGSGGVGHGSGLAATGSRAARGEGVFAGSAQVTRVGGAVRDERSRGPAPTHDSLRRNDEAAGYARAPCDAASRICPTAPDISRLRGEQTHRASPSNTVMRLRRI